MIKLPKVSIIKSKKEVCRCNKHLVRIDADHYYCANCKQLFTKAKKIKR